MCDCIDQVDKQLEPQNARIVTCMLINRETGKTRLSIGVPLEKVNKKDRRPLIRMSCSYCPFCGEQWRALSARGES